MKVTRDQLRRIIKEELSRTLVEIEFSAGPAMDSMGRGADQSKATAYDELIQRGNPDPRSAPRRNQGRDLSTIIAKGVKDTFTSDSDLNRLANLIDVSRITRWPSVAEAGEDLLDKKDAESSAIFVLSVLDAIPAGGLALNMTKQGAAEALGLINDEVLEDAGLSELQIKTAKKAVKDAITAMT